MTIRLHLPGPSAATGPVRPASRRAVLTTRTWLVAANLAAVTFFLFSWSRYGVTFGPYRIDLDVYRIGSQAWLHGGDLYGALPATSNGTRLPFSYPPIAAVVLSPLSLLPMAAATTALTLVTIGLAAVVLRLFLRSAAGTRAGSWRTVAWLLPLALFLEPVRNTLIYGQVNLAAHGARVSGLPDRQAALAARGTGRRRRGDQADAGRVRRYSSCSGGTTGRR